MKWLHLALGLCLALPVSAQWDFGAAIDIGPPQAGVFHHLDAAGRQAIGVSGKTVAVVWEDNRGGASACYLAIGQASEFREFKFGQGECYEPGLTKLDKERFALIWEDEQGIRVALADARTGVGQPLGLAPQGRQGTLTWHHGLGLFAAWSQPDGRWQRLYLARLTEKDGLRRPGAVRPVEAAPPVDDQLHPALAAAATGVTVAWEDRRHGHTVIYASQSPEGTTWSAPTRLSQNPTGRAEGNLGRGTGAMRPALAAFGKRLAAVWLDKRDFLSGYDVYSASSEDGLQFGKNTLVQDDFGANIAQWHAAVAGNARGDLVFAWDDERDGSADIWLTWATPGGYAENMAPPPASGPGHQSDPALALDAEGYLHLAWLERGAEGVTRLRYAKGHRR